MNSGALDGFDLTIKQRKFCLAYVGIANGNGTEACRVAEYEGNDVTLAAVAYENLSKPQIKSAIEYLRGESEAELFNKITDVVMDAAEVRSNLSRLARGAEKDADRIRATELMGKILGEFPNKVEISSAELEDAFRRAHAQFPRQIPLPPSFAVADEDAPAS